MIFNNTLQKSEISLTTKQACGLQNIHKTNVSITSMINRRILGCGFSIGDKCRISNSFLPNKMHQVAKYNSKAFCGTYSQDGRFFLTASQGMFDLIDFLFILINESYFLQIDSYVSIIQLMVG